MSLSPQTSAPGYAPNAPGYGTWTVAEVNHTAFATAYTCKPTDDLVLVDLASYSTGPTINWSPTPQERMRVCVRNTTGNASSKTFTIAAPSGMTIEDPANPGSFAGTVTTSVANFSGIWELDRPNNRLVAVCCSGAAAATMTPFTFDTADSTPHTVQTVTLPASPHLVNIEVHWNQSDSATPASSGGGFTQSTWQNVSGTPTQRGSTTDVYKDASAGSSVSFAPGAGATVVVQVNGNGDASQHWTGYVITFPSA